MLQKVNSCENSAAYLENYSVSNTLTTINQNCQKTTQSKSLINITEFSDQSYLELPEQEISSFQQIVDIYESLEKPVENYNSQQFLKPQNLMIQDYQNNKNFNENCSEPSSSPQLLPHSSLNISLNMELKSPNKIFSLSSNQNNNNQNQNNNNLQINFANFHQNQPTYQIQNQYQYNNNYKKQKKPLQKQKQKQTQQQYSLPNTYHVVYNMFYLLLKYLCNLYQNKIPCTCSKLDFTQKTKCKRCVELKICKKYKALKIKSKKTMLEFMELSERFPILSEQFFLYSSQNHILCHKYKNPNSQEIQYNSQQIFLLRSRGIKTKSMSNFK